MTMIHTVPAGNWATQLAVIIAHLDTGDTLRVSSAAQQALAQRAIQRTRPELQVTIVVQPAEED